MQRFVNRRSSSSVDLDSSSLDDVRTQRAAIALSVGLSWSPVLWTPQLAAAVGTCSSGAHPPPPRGSALSPRTAAGLVAPRRRHRPLTHEEIAHTSTPCALLPPTAAAALVENEPSGSAARRRKIHVDPFVRDWFLDVMSDVLHAEGLDVRLCLSWVKGLLRGMRLSYKKLAKCVKELHCTEQQHANKHRLFIKLCWLMGKHAVSEDRVVNIDETTCRLLLVHQSGWGRRGVKQAQLQGNTRERTTFPVDFGMARGPLDVLVQIVHAGKTDAVLPEHTHHVTSENGWATTTTTLHLVPHPRDDVTNSSVDPSLGHGQHPRQRGHHDRHVCEVPSRRAVLHPAAQHLVLSALRRGRLPQLQELHPDACECRSYPLRPRRVVRRLGHEQGGDDSLRPNGQLEQSRTSATKSRRGRLVGVACAPTATTNSARPLKRPTSCTPLATCSGNRSNQSRLRRACRYGPS